MGNAFFTSFCHKHARLSMIDKILNFVLLWLFPVRWLGEQSIGEKERMRRLQQLRQKMSSFNALQYRPLAKNWVGETVELPRLCGNGGPVVVVMHTPVGCKAKASDLSREDLPLFIWLHGGGLNLGDACDGWGADLLGRVASSGPDFCWASVEYRLAPEATFPAPVEDAVSAFMALKDAKLAEQFGYSVSKMSLGGCSGGAFLAAHAALRLSKEFQEVPKSVALMYPMVEPSMASKSHEDFGDLYCHRDWIKVSWEWTLTKDGCICEEKVKDCNLLLRDFASIQSSKLLLTLGQFDLMRDDGIALGKALVDACGSHVQIVESPGSHALLVDATAREQVVRWFRSALV